MWHGRGQFCAACGRGAAEKCVLAERALEQRGYTSELECK